MRNIGDLCHHAPSTADNLTWEVLVCTRRGCPNEGNHRYMDEAVMLSQTAGPEGFIHPNWFFLDRERMEQAGRAGA